MSAKAATMATEDWASSAKDIANSVLTEFEELYKTTAAKLLSNTQLQQAVYDSRRKHGRDYYGAITSHPLAYAEDDSSNFFLQFCNTFLLNGELHKIIGWAHPELCFYMAAAALHLFIDCTFQCVPSGFAQVMVIMAYSQPHDYYMPVFFILMTHRTEDDYMHALQAFISSMSWRLKVLSLSCDFEKALINACKCQFPDAFILGCLFHFKQALRRKLLKLGVAVQLVSDFVVRGGPADWLTVMHVDEILSKGVQFIMANFDCGKFKKEFLSFWTYFEKEWLKAANIHCWNLTAALACPDEIRDLVLRFRTNNPLEHFNQTLHRLFRGRPNVVQFVHGIREHSQQVVVHLNRIKKQVARPVEHDLNAYVPELPAAYAEFGRKP
ncbi:unnamed protein product, partial [Heterosigma akashiwo]